MTDLLSQTRVATLFLENSTRTFFSSRAAVGLAGGEVDGFPTPDNTSLKKGETLAETMLTFADYFYDAIVMRSTAEGLPRWIRDYLDHQNDLELQQNQLLGFPYTPERVMIVNGGDGKVQHPTQCFLDLFTFKEIAEGLGKELEGLELALLNDIAYGRTHSSLMSVAHLFNFKLHLAYPEHFGPTQGKLDDLVSHGVEFHLHDQDFLSAMREAQIAYQSRPQKERVAKRGMNFDLVKKQGQITPQMAAQLGEEMPFLMHPKPMDAETFEEIHHDLLFHPKYVAARQSKNGIPVRIALFALGLGIIESQHLVTLSERREESFFAELPLGQSEKRKDNPKTGYIAGEGVVIDHIPAGRGRRLEGVLGFEVLGLPLVPAYHVPVENGRLPEKDMLKIHANYNFSNKQLEAIALIAPEATISFIESGKVTRKIRPFVGNYVSERIQCSNQDCVSNIPVEHVPYEHNLETHRGKNFLRCKFCETIDTVDDAFNEKRLVYLK